MGDLSCWFKVANVGIYEEEKLVDPTANNNSMIHPIYKVSLTEGHTKLTPDQPNTYDSERT